MVNISKTGTRPKKNSLIIGKRTLWQEEHVRLQVLGFPPAQQILFIARVWVDADGAGPGAPDQAWTAYDGANPYIDFDGTGQLQTRYLYGPGIDELFARIGAAEDPQWYLTDRLGSVRQIVDAEGSILDDIIYDSFGNVLSESNPSQGDRFKFTGREFSPELGIYYYRARWYDPSSGRFISQDPIGFQAGDPNLYRYVGNAPGDGVDPEGLARINIGNANDGRISVGYQGSWGLFYGSEEFIGYLDPKTNSVERNGKWVSLNKLERIASSWWGFKPDWDEYFQENGYDPNADSNATYITLSIELGLYNDSFINDFATGMGQITDLYETVMWHYAGAGFACGSGGSGKIPSNRLTNQRYGSATSPLPKHQVPNIPGSPATSLGPGWTWRGKPGEPIGGDKGAWFNPKTGETLHPDLGHGVSVGPHWDWRDPDGNFWRLFPDGRIKPRG